MQKSSSRFTPPVPDPIRVYSTGAGDRVKLVIDGHEIPYVELVDVTAEWLRIDTEPEKFADPARGRLAQAARNGERIFNLTVDNRFGHVAAEGDLFGWAFFLAHAMAVSAGYTSHGRNSRRINRHGVSL